MTTVSDYISARTTAQMMLRKKLVENSGSLEEQEIRQTVLSVVGFLGVQEIDVERLIIELDSQFQTIIGTERVLSGVDGGWSQWLPERRGSIDWTFWDHYRQHLSNEKGWPDTTVDSLDDSTDRVLGLITNPTTSGSWDRRGMVVGHVQSGKTAHYTGLINKAADAGYKVIVILTGFNKSLRSQTQIRLEEGFLGYDLGASTINTDGRRVTVGVGNPELYSNHPLADSITTRSDDGDFKRSIANNFAINPGGNPLLFVVKKNGSVLRNLMNWVKWVAQDTDEDGNPYIRDVPFLLIDDEADLGSIDTSKGAFDENGELDPDHDPTALNRRVRGLLRLFDQSAYVGYTATPFANIFIHEQAATKQLADDLFPRSFIVSLPTPSNYIGPVQVFGQDPEDDNPTPATVREIFDHAESLAINEREGWIPPRHNKEHIPLVDGVSTVPASLNTAVLSFILAAATRRARGDTTAHNSMLVHVTRLTAVQERVATQIRTLVAGIRANLRHGHPGESDFIADDLKDLWTKDFQPTTKRMKSEGLATDCPDLTWDQIWQQIVNVVESIEVREINGLAGEVLDYTNHETSGLCVIAVGGDKLSRGLTLEGLSVSYFLRASRMYDTLMQMGRWFGYRPGYSDVCRIFTTPEMIDWFEHIALASEELRQDFKLMSNSGATPREFGHRVKSHPLLLVTSRVKMRHGVSLDLSLRGGISETINFWRDSSSVRNNWEAGTRLIEALIAENGDPSSGYLRRASDSSARAQSNFGPARWDGVSADLIIQFLSGYSEHTASRKVITSLLSSYISAENTQGDLVNWTVLIASGGSKNGHNLIDSEIKQINRAWHGSKQVVPQLADHNHYRIKRLVNPPDEGADLSTEEYAKALRITIKDWEEDDDPRRSDNEPTQAIGWAIRMVRQSKNGLLMLYPLSSTFSSTTPITAEPDANKPVLGFAISFPGYDPDKVITTRYVVNNVYWRQEYDNSDEGPIS